MKKDLEATDSSASTATVGTPGYQKKSIAVQDSTNGGGAKSPVTPVSSTASATPQPKISIEKQNSVSTMAISQAGRFSCTAIVIWLVVPLGVRCLGIKYAS